MSFYRNSILVSFIGLSWACAPIDIPQLESQNEGLEQIIDSLDLTIDRSRNNISTPAYQIDRDESGYLTISVEIDGSQLADAGLLRSCASEDSLTDLPGDEVIDFGQDGDGVLVQSGAAGATCSLQYVPLWKVEDGQVTYPVVESAVNTEGQSWFDFSLCTIDPRGIDASIDCRDFRRNHKAIEGAVVENVDSGLNALQEQEYVDFLDALDFLRTTVQCDLSGCAPAGSKQNIVEYMALGGSVQDLLGARETVLRDNSVGLALRNGGGKTTRQAAPLPPPRLGSKAPPLPPRTAQDGSTPGGSQGNGSPQGSSQSSTIRPKPASKSQGKSFGKRVKRTLSSAASGAKSVGNAVVTGVKGVGRGVKATGKAVAAGVKGVAKFGKSVGSSIKKAATSISTKVKKRRNKDSNGDAPDSSKSDASILEKNAESNTVQEAGKLKRAGRKIKQGAKYLLGAVVLFTIAAFTYAALTDSDDDSESDDQDSDANEDSSEGASAASQLSSSDSETTSQLPASGDSNAWNEYSEEALIYLGGS